LVPNCSFVSYSGAGTLWLLGNNIHWDCGLRLVEGNAPQGQIVSIGNVQGGPNPFATLTAARVISGVDAFYHGQWTGAPTSPFTRWIPDGTPPPKLNTYPPPVPLPPEDILPPSLTRPVMTAALPGMINVKAAPYNAVGNGIADDTAAIQAALDADCTAA